MLKDLWCKISSSNVGGPNGKKEKQPSEWGVNKVSIYRCSGYLNLYYLIINERDSLMLITFDLSGNWFFFFFKD